MPISWSSFFIALVGLIYFGTVIAFLVEGRPWKALIFFGYVIGQLGFMLDDHFNPAPVEIVEPADSNSAAHGIGPA